MFAERGSVIARHVNQLIAYITDGMPASLVRGLFMLVFIGIDASLLVALDLPTTIIRIVTLADLSDAFEEELLKEWYDWMLSKSEGTFFMRVIMLLTFVIALLSLLHQSINAAVSVVMDLVTSLIYVAVLGAREIVATPIALATWLVSQMFYFFRMDLKRAFGHFEMPDFLSYGKLFGLGALRGGRARSPK